jgi:hypothetical protein
MRHKKGILDGLCSDGKCSTWQKIFNSQALDPPVNDFLPAQTTRLHISRNNSKQFDRCIADDGYSFVK